MSGPNNYKMAGESNATAGFGDTTYTKIFVGGLAWETKRDTLKHYFEQFGEILEAVVINDKSTGRSKGYGFVTFTDAESSMRACHNPFPVIDGRRANCNLASLGAQKNRPPSASHHVMGREKFSPSSPSPSPRVVAAPSPGTPAFYRQLIPQYAFPYSAYGYPGNYTTQDIYPMNYYNAYPGQGQGQGQFPISHYSSSGTSGTPGLGGGVYLSYFPVYVQHQHGHGHGHSHGQSSPSPTQPHYPKLIHYPYSPQQHRAVGTVTLPPPPSNSSSLSATVGAATAEVTPGTASASAQNS